MWTAASRALVGVALSKSRFKELLLSSGLAVCQRSSDITIFTTQYCNVRRLFIMTICVQCSMHYTNSQALFFWLYCFWFQLLFWTGCSINIFGLCLVLGFLGRLLVCRSAARVDASVSRVKLTTEKRSQRSGHLSAADNRDIFRPECLGFRSVFLFGPFLFSVFRQWWRFWWWWDASSLSHLCPGELWYYLSLSLLVYTEVSHSETLPLPALEQFWVKNYRVYVAPLKKR